MGWSHLTLQTFVVVAQPSRSMGPKGRADKASLDAELAAVVATKLQVGLEDLPPHSEPDIPTRPRRWRGASSRGCGCCA